MSAKKRTSQKATERKKPQRFAEDYRTTVRCLSCNKARQRNVVGVREFTRTEVKLECPHCGRNTIHTQTET